MLCFSAISGNCYSVDLKKGSQGLGFSINGGEPSVEDDTIQYVSRVKRVFPIGPAADSKRILAGDVILLVNGKDMRKLNHSVSNTSEIALYNSFYPPKNNCIIFSHENIWVLSQENLFLLHVNNKGAYQTAHPRSLINTIVIRRQESTIVQLATCKNFNILASLCS